MSMAISQNKKSIYKKPAVSYIPAMKNQNWK